VTDLRIEVAGFGASAGASAGGASSELRELKTL
jgi:hypothetical protein